MQEAALQTNMWKIFSVLSRESIYAPWKNKNAVNVVFQEGTGNWFQQAQAHPLVYHVKYLTNQRSPGTNYSRDFSM